MDSDLSAFRKIQLEGLFHDICNGGCITYVELGEAPLGNDEGLLEYIEHAIKSGVHYLGFNFPKDVCNECGASGVFDECPVCKSKDITRIRRVSGYLEILDGFTKGKKNEEKIGEQTKLATFFTSDIHFSDERIMKLCDRPFSNVKEMDEYIVDKWNKKFLITIRFGFWEILLVQNTLIKICLIG